MGMDLFKSEKKTELCKELLRSLTENAEVTGDAVIINTFFDVARNLHDSVDSLTFEDERKQISSLICEFIDKIEYGKDVQKTLNKMVECRAAFPNLDKVQDRLVLRVAGLTMQAHRLVKGKHSRKTISFVKACLAYCHITIPSI